MAEFPYLPLATDAYLADTTHLSTEEHGAYLLLLMAAWRSAGCRLPDDDAFLARVCRCTARVWLRIRPSVASFWLIEGGWWSQKRLSKEREYVDGVRERRREAAHAKHRKNKKTPDAPAHADAPASALHFTSLSSSLRSEDTDSSLRSESRSPADETAVEPHIAVPGETALRRVFREEFWPAYPRKIGKDKAEPKFVAKAKAVGPQVILDGLHRYVRHWRERGTENDFIPHPTTWLSGGRWADDLSQEQNSELRGRGPLPAPLRRTRPSITAVVADLYESDSEHEQENHRVVGIPAHNDEAGRRAQRR